MYNFAYKIKHGYDDLFLCATDHRAQKPKIHTVAQINLIAVVYFELFPHKMLNQGTKYVLIHS